MKNNQRNITLIFIAMFFFSVNVAVTGYINSSFLESLGWSNTIISLVYTTSSIIALISLPKIQQFTLFFGNKRFIKILLLSSLLSLCGIAFINQIYIQLFSFLIFLILNFLIIFDIDIFIEHFSRKKDTGKIRGTFFTIINFAWAISPLLAGALIDTYNNTDIIYIVAIACVSISFIIFKNNFKNLEFKKKKPHGFLSMLNKLLINNDLRNVFPISAMLHFVYASSLIYIPLHLHSVIGLSWIEIGSLLLISNIPYLILGYPIGYIADKYIGEKEMMIGGLIIASIGLIGFSTLKYPVFIAWAIIFFISRVGLSLIETTTESYIFKKIKHNDIEMLSIERNAIPIGYLLAPFVGFCVSLFTDSYIPIFVITGILLLVHIYPATKINDTK